MLLEMITGHEKIDYVWPGSGHDSFTSNNHKVRREPYWPARKKNQVVLAWHLIIRSSCLPSTFCSNSFVACMTHLFRSYKRLTKSNTYEQQMVLESQSIFIIFIRSTSLVKF